MALPKRLTLELLEDRSMPSVFGTAWLDAEHLTISFAPDGTAIDDQASTLFQTLDATMSRSEWQREILRAIQTWAVQADINVGLVGDGGQGIGINGAVQSDARFGDFRIGASSMGTHLAVNTPFNLLTATRAGDIVFNTDSGFGINDSSRYDIFSTVLSEFGNALGIPDNDDPTSVLYRYYNGVRTGLSASDSDAIQSLYGPRLADDYEGLLGNNDFATATNLSVGAVSADITSLTDADVYRFTVPSGASIMSLRVQTGGISLLTPSLTIYDSLGNIVATASTTDPLTGQLVLQLDNLSAGEVYYAKVESGSQDVFGIGGYRLRLWDGPASTMPAPVNNNDLSGGTLVEDNHKDDTLDKAANLNKKRYSTDPQFDYRLRGVISDSTDVYWYKLSSPTAASGASQTLVAMVWNLDTDGLYPKVTVRDRFGNAVNAEVLVNDHGAFSVQVQNAASDATYYVKVVAASSTNHSTGHYMLGVDFRSSATNLDSYASNTLSGLKPEAYWTLHNSEDQLFHYTLAGGGTGTAIRMTIYDSNLKEVFSATTWNGDTISANVFLAAGTYTVRFEAGSAGGLLPLINVSLNGLLASDPLDPLPTDPTVVPIGGPTFYWTQGGGSSGGTISQTDPYSNPWWQVFGL